jgi:hypothetical protein
VLAGQGVVQGVDFGGTAAVGVNLIPLAASWIRLPDGR